MDIETAPIPLADLRAEAGLSQRKLAKAIGKSPSFINLLESGSRGASVATLGKLRKALNLDPDQYAGLSAWIAQRTEQKAAA